MAGKSTERFSDRVENYVRYRPDYPAGVIDYLRENVGLSSQSVVADIGSGTGIFTRYLLEAGCRVLAVEPNGPMRAAAEDLLGGFRGFFSVDGTAGNTGLGAQVADSIVCAQAFHWFNTPDTKAEFQRILKPGGFVALIWNNRLTDADAFSVAYERLLQDISQDYREVNHQNLGEEDFRNFFSGDYDKVCFPNEQVFDEAGLIGRAFSSSYVPAADTEAGGLVLERLKTLFREYETDGKITFRYETEVYLGRL